jgi:hypothetical protein
MATTQELRYTITPLLSLDLEDHPELARLLAASIVNPAFCRLLLANPLKAIETGYRDESFQLDETEKNLLASMHAETLQELAQGIYETFNIKTQPPRSSFNEMLAFTGI